MPAFAAPGASPAALPASGWPEALLLARVRFTLAAEAPVHFAQPPGATLWSALGRTAHTLDRDLYTHLFKPVEPRGAVPSPFVLSLKEPHRLRYAPGQKLVFDLTLVGWAVAHLSFFVEAALLIEHSGLGTDRAQGAGRVRLLHVAGLDLDERENVLLERDGLACQLTPPLVNGYDIARRASTLPADLLTLRFVTLTHLRKGGEHLRRPRFEHVVARLGWRLHELLRLHCDAEVDFRPLVERARHVRTVALNVQDRREARYSRRQSNETEQPVTIPVHGFTGTLTVAGDLAPFRPMLLCGQWLHIGKDTERGYGRYLIEPALLPGE